MIDYIRDWFKQVTLIETAKVDWNVESIELERVELDNQLLPSEYIESFD